MPSRRLLLATSGVLLLLIVSSAVVPASAANRRPPPGRKRGTKSSRGTVEVPPEPIEDLSVAGRILPVLRTFALTRDKLRAVWDALTHAVDLEEFVLLAFAGWAMVPVASALSAAIKNARPALPYAVWRASAAMREEEGEIDDEVWAGVEDEEGGEDEVEGGGISSGGKEPMITVLPKQFRDTYLYRALDRIAQAARIGAAVYAVDCLAVVLNAMGFPYKQQAGFSKKAGKISFTVWAALQVSRLKRHLFDRAVRDGAADGEESDLGRMLLLDKALGAVLWIITGGQVLDMLDVDVGMTVKSLLAFGGVGTLVLSLASKDLASEFVSGLVLSSSDRFYEGDEIQLGDGTSGIIQKMGLFYTDLRGFDEITTRIPNSQLGNQRARNVSRVQKCQVKQTLWFGYEDIMKMPEVITAIKEEIRASCPALILDGSRPFRVHWREFQHDHLEVVVDCHFNIKPSGNVYWDNKQKVLEAIARAVHQLGVQFTLPARICHK